MASFQCKMLYDTGNTLDGLASPPGVGVFTLKRGVIQGEKKSFPVLIL